jgi:LPXTG-motif cell wall-anchored protein
MSKVLTLLVALAMFAAIPAVASAQGTSPSGGGDTVSSGNEQEGEIEQDAEAGSGGNAGNQACLIQQNAGRDANAACNQEQNFTTQNNVNRGVGGDNDNDNVNNGVGGGNVTGVGGGNVGVGGGGVQNVTLARTGFNAWVLALIGGVALAGGLGLLAVQRRLSA